MTDVEISISARALSLRRFFEGARFATDIYQRGYVWGRAEIGQLLADLTRAYDAHRETGLQSYFLGPVVTHAAGDNVVYLVDGQQRTTTLVLLLLWLARRLQGEAPGGDIARLVEPENGVFAFDTPDYRSVFVALREEERFESPDMTDAQRALAGRYADIDALFPDDLIEGDLAGFARWLIDRVFVADIRTASDDDAYRIFETMNGRGVQLGPADLFKSWALSQIDDQDTRIAAAEGWTEAQRQLQRAGPGRDHDGLKAWLKARYADLSPQGKKTSDRSDIDTRAFQWVRANAARLGLVRPADFARFLGRDFPFYAEVYARLKAAESEFDPALPEMSLVGAMELGWAYDILIAAYDPDAGYAAQIDKTAAALRFVDVLAARLAWRGRTSAGPASQRLLERVARELRTADPDGARQILGEALAIAAPAGFSPGAPSLEAMAESIARPLLARLSAFADREAFGEVDQGRYAGLALEPVAPAAFEAAGGAFLNRADHRAARSMLGGMALIPARLRDALQHEPLSSRRELLAGDGALAASLDPASWAQNENLRAFGKAYGYDEPGAVFDLSEIARRQALMAALAAGLWGG